MHTLAAAGVNEPFGLERLQTAEQQNTPSRHCISHAPFISQIFRKASRKARSAKILLTLN